MGSRLIASVRQAAATGVVAVLWSSAAAHSCQRVPGGNKLQAYARNSGRGRQASNGICACTVPSLLVPFKHTLPHHPPQTPPTHPHLHGRRVGIAANLDGQGKLGLEHRERAQLAGEYKVEQRPGRRHGTQRVHVSLVGWCRVGVGGGQGFASRSRRMGPGVEEGHLNRACSSLGGCHQRARPDPPPHTIHS